MCTSTLIRLVVCKRLVHFHFQIFLKPIFMMEKLVKLKIKHAKQMRFIKTETNWNIFFRIRVCVGGGGKRNVKPS